MTWDKTFLKSDNVTIEKVSFVNRYGITLVGYLYMPKSLDNGLIGPLPAVAVSGPFGAVKEQCSGLYAQTLAENGFIALAFDPSFTGESGGGQILLVTSGAGWYQEWGKAPQSLKPGDVVHIRPGVKHWHGAKKDSEFTHLAIEVPGENVSTSWLEPVLDDFYNTLTD